MPVARKSLVGPQSRGLEAATHQRVPGPARQQSLSPALCTLVSQGTSHLTDKETEAQETAMGRFKEGLRKPSSLHHPVPAKGEERSQLLWRRGDRRLLHRLTEQVPVVHQLSATHTPSHAPYSPKGQCSNSDFWVPVNYVPLGRRGQVLRSAVPPTCDVTSGKPSPALVLSSQEEGRTGTGWGGGQGSFHLTYWFPEDLP